MAKRPRLPHWQVAPECNRALYGWPYNAQPCPGYIESDHELGSFSPCATCNPDWNRVSAAAARSTEGR